MNKEYSVHNKSLTKVLNDIDDFIEKMEVFKEKHNYYNYTINIDRVKNRWSAVVKITKDEKTRES